jgi:hypothetical protein
MSRLSRYPMPHSPSPLFSTACIVPTEGRNSANGCGQHLTRGCMP